MPPPPGSATMAGRYAWARWRSPTAAGSSNAPTRRAWFSPWCRRSADMTITPCLWFDKQAEEAADFYASVFPDSRVDKVTRTPSDYPNGKAGDVITVEFTLMGRPFMGLNGGPEFRFSEAVSFSIACEDQAEVDRYWDALTANGGEPGPCGWCK